VNNPEQKSTYHFQLTKDGYYIQDSAHQTLCTALSLANFIHTIFPDKKLSESEVAELANKVPLSEEVIREQLALQDLQLQKLPLPEEVQTDYRVYFEHLANFLNNSPFLLTISSLLSKRDRAVQAEQTFADREEHKEKTIAHVVVMRINENMVEIIDPYDPSQQEKFDISEHSEQLRLIAWIMSVHFELITSAHSAVELLEETLSKINNPVTFDRNCMLGTYRANIIWTKPVVTRFQHQLSAETLIKPPEVLLNRQEFNLITERLERHSFDFGYQYPIKNGLAEIVFREDKSYLVTKFPSLEDETWYGNCASDVLLCKQYLSQYFPRESLHIQQLDEEQPSKKRDTFSHFQTRLAVRTKDGFLSKDFDHSPYHQKRFNAVNQDIKNIVELDQDEQTALEKDTVSLFQGIKTEIHHINKLAYCEFDFEGKRAIAYFSFRLNETYLVIIFEVFAPGHPQLETGKSASLSYNISSKTRSDFDASIAALHRSSIKLSCAELPEPLLPTLKEWYREIATALPENIFLPDSEQTPATSFWKNILKQSNLSK
jgi:hypothetical protein